MKAAEIDGTKLCSGCGKFKDDADLLLAANHYLTERSK